MWWMANALAAPMVERVTAGESWKGWALADGAHVVIHFTGDLDGSAVPCPCGDDNPGGVARIVAVHHHLQPALLVDAGGWARATPSEEGPGLHAEASAANAVMRSVMSDWDVLGVGYRDLPGLGVDLPSSARSATAVGGLPTWARFDVAGISLVVTSVSGAGMLHMQPTGWTWPTPEDALRTALSSVSDADVVVVLAFDVGDVETLLQLPHVDVVIDATRAERPLPASAVGDAVWAHTVKGGWLGELRLWVEEGVVVRAVDRHLPLGVHVPEDRDVLKQLSEKPLRHRRSTSSP